MKLIGITNLLINNNQLISYKILSYENDKQELINPQNIKILTFKIKNTERYKKPHSKINKRY